MIHNKNDLNLKYYISVVILLLKKISVVILKKISVV
jgi:hypothetical protein